MSDIVQPMLQRINQLQLTKWLKRTSGVRWEFILISRYCQVVCAGHVIVISVVHNTSVNVKQELFTFYIKQSTTPVTSLIYIAVCWWLMLIVCLQLWDYTSSVEPIRRRISFVTTQTVRPQHIYRLFLLLQAKSCFVLAFGDSLEDQTTLETC